MTALQTGATIGILGGGQLGRMLASAAARLGFDASILCPEADCPAARVAASHELCDYSDLDKVLAWAESCDVITYEFENVPVETAEALLAARHLVRPGAEPLRASQDRVAEKTFLAECDIPTAPFVAIDAADQIAEALAQVGGQGILKTRRDGYDGKGQVRIESGDDMDAAFLALNEKPAILEGLVPFELEVSVIIARAPDGLMVSYDVPQNEHANGILKRSSLPAPIRSETRQKAVAAAERLVASLDYVGVLALEFFVLADGSVVANEFAPRVHNSGHWTPEACATGQFEQHIRAVAGWPLGPVTRFHDCEMLNLLGEETVDVDRSDGILTLYGKRDPKPGRKMGHLVRLSPRSEGS